MQTPAGHLDSRDFRRIARAIGYIDAHWREQPSLAALAAVAGLSRFHFSRLFRRWAGISPRQYLQHVTGLAAKAHLRGHEALLEAALATGLSGPGRLHDLIVTLEAMTPAEYARGGAGVHIEYGFAPTPFGLMLCGRTPRGICHLGFEPDADRRRAERALRADWPQAALHGSDAVAVELARRLWAPRPAGGHCDPLRLQVRGTNFQLRVWRALLELDAAAHCTYGALARQLGAAGAARAVGRAVGANPVAWIIPCHRVLRGSGALGGYRWGLERKRAMLAWEGMPVPSLAVGLATGISVNY
ncbi:MAG: methylated-DNA--[protein]-cysteine S-methyltransferase [Gammaproteobacteria bacterium]|nr:methylated-DNA--[protein]-cysteine S-methyltransferase [Gammaproteobacteria bacterium]